jgi:Tfp pilus assembly protein PilZ
VGSPWESWQPPFTILGIIIFILIGFFNKFRLIIFPHANHTSLGGNKGFATRYSPLPQRPGTSVPAGHRLASPSPRLRFAKDRFRHPNVFPFRPQIALTRRPAVLALRTFLSNLSFFWHSMENLFKSFKELHLGSRKEKRQYPRKGCFIELKYRVRNRWYDGSIQDISDGGAYVRSSKRHSPGEDILLDIPLRVLGDQLKGKIIWVRTHGMGVQFQSPGHQHRESEGVQKDNWRSIRIEESENMGKIKGRKIRWESSSTPDVKYRLYWSIGGGVDYHSDHADVGNVTEVNLPNEIPAFPLTSGRFELGISAITEAGNESELTKATVNIDFTVPEPPKNLMVEDV